ncbi:MAG: hypothetical protein KatS3mg131_2593 [Candidatus Tectimicrobiota bacterium]|nr:MAG: hypothetical protein KatS3mg131_2593 [Candidatus Tectomicrobia bacterium]
MNFYALIPLLAFVINVFTLAYILAQKGKKPVNRALQLLCVLPCPLDARSVFSVVEPS